MAAAAALAVSPDALPARVWLPGGREVVLGWCEVGPEDDASLSPIERQGLARCRTDKRRREFVAGRLAAHRALELLAPGTRAEVTARADGQDAGRPLLEPTHGLALSLTHSTGLAVAALARGAPLGVDLERTVEVSEAFLEEAFCPGEREGYEPLCAGRMDTTTATWAMKEAVLKVWGVGLRAPLLRVAVRPALLAERGGLLSLRLTVETEALPPHLGAPPTLLDAVLLAWEDRVLALAG
ncbi:MAG TPA: 4'-phosphopantetheinyl transferase superfamily protein [Archangium sp.]|uniref:4'-phosphopantetheinyl transferase family protein n=1 Tax=Archangium sp. TaxID=1872627 RepID=UPI002ED97FC1